MSRQDQDKEKEDDLWNVFKQEFNKENFSLNFERNKFFLKKDPEDVLEYFHSSIWPCCNRFIYLIYRLCIAVYYTLWFVESIARNVEYRATKTYIGSKEKADLLLLHPWPTYMTSWSLTILLIHLWLSAFIVLYFYSIDQKTRFYKLFTYLFGPFSCSKPVNKNKNKRSDDESDFFQKIVKFCIQNKKNENQASIPVIYNITDQIIKPTVDQIKENESSTLIESIETKTTTIILEEPTTHEKTTIKIKTYCENKQNCQMPSSAVGYDADRWKQWIKMHVPCVILFSIKTSWLLYTNIATSAILVSIGYFTFVSIGGYKVESTWAAEIGNLHRHGINSLVVIIDLILLGYPVRILHFVYISLYGWVYACVTFIYWMSNPVKNIIYEQIDYNKPFMVLGYYLILTALTFVMQILHFLAYQFKLFIRDKYLKMRLNCASKVENP